MGAGAGCDIEIKNCNVVSVDSVDLQGAKLEVDGWYAGITVDCIIKLVGTIRVSSYYDSTGDIEEVSMTVRNVTIQLDIGNGNNSEVLTAEAIDRFENQFDGDIESITEQFLPILTVADIDPNYLRSELSYGVNYTGDGRFGGGWVGSTFSGDFEIDEVDSHSGYNPIGGYSCSVDDEMVIDFIDKAKYGDNIEYTVFYNGDIMETYNTLDEAIVALKDEILADVENADLYECYVESAYYFLRNGSIDNYEFDTDIDSAQVEYRASDDADFDFDGLADAVDEMNDENDIGIDEGFDI